MNDRNGSGSGRATIPPGATIGILGGGQLGRMTALAAAELGYRIHVFTPETGSKRHGLGLVRRLVEQIRGNVTVASEQGTVWTVQFPLAFAAEPMMPAN